MNEITIVTAQNVTLKIELANIGDRFLAAILDFLVKLGLTLLVSFAISFIGNGGGTNVFWWVFFVVVWVLYSLIFEFFMKGQTPGKRIMKIRVARLDGEQVSFGSLLLRWLFRIIDFPLSAVPAIGIFTIVSTEKYQRLGDLIAGTILVSTKNRNSLNDTFYTPTEQGYTPVFPQAERLTGSEAEIIQEALHLYIEKDKYELVQLASKQVKSLLQVDTDMDDLTFLRSVLKDYNYSGSAKATEQSTGFSFSAS